MWDDGRDNNGVFTDEYGDEHFQDSDGKVHRGMPPMQTHKITNPDDDFKVFDSSRGHCPFCGRITCNGGCFK